MTFIVGGIHFSSGKNKKKVYIRLIVKQIQNIKHNNIAFELIRLVSIENNSPTYIIYIFPISLHYYYTMLSFKYKILKK